MRARNYHASEACFTVAAQNNLVLFGRELQVIFIFIIS